MFARGTHVLEADIAINMLARHRYVLGADGHAGQIKVDEHRCDRRWRGGGIGHAHHDGKVRERRAADVVLLR
jgi:hypothetical protein